MNWNYKFRYRIRENKTVVFIPGPLGINAMTIKRTYIVERRLCWFWWFRESKNIYGLEDEFSTFQEAEFYIKKRSGKLQYIC